MPDECLISKGTVHFTGVLLVANRRENRREIMQPAQIAFENAGFYGFYGFCRLLMDCE